MTDNNGNDGNDDNNDNRHDREPDVSVRTDYEDVGFSVDISDPDVRLRDGRTPENVEMQLKPHRRVSSRYVVERRR